MRFTIRTYGCRANQYDSERIRELLTAAGAVEVDSADDADVAIFNSCTVTAAAEAELRKDVRRADQKRRGLRTIISGCAAALPNRDEAINPLATLPSVSHIVPGADLDQLAVALGINANLVTRHTTEQSGARALLRIQDGCNEHCTFCATTMARGDARSRTVDELIAEAARLAGHHPEIVITGIHIGAYGIDCGGSLGELMHALIRNVPRARFRLTSIEATEIDDRLLELFSEPTRLAPHLHAPLQSGSDRILRRMGRHWYTSSSYRKRIEGLIERCDILGLSADLIAGFPGESLDDHSMTMQVVTDLPFTSLHVFPFSPRPGTAATRLGHSVPNAEIARRARELRDLGERKSKAYAASRLGGRADVVVVERGRGLTGDYLSVAVSDDFRRRDRFDATLEFRDGGVTAIPS
ncbi:MAG TPA: MiaB/RimO family radical SAM methylthiotransferase [Gemmatimonadaceae bacterium]